MSQIYVNYANAFNGLALIYAVRTVRRIREETLNMEFGIWKYCLAKWMLCQLCYRNAGCVLYCANKSLCKVFMAYAQWLPLFYNWQNMSTAIELDRRIMAKKHPHTKKPKHYWIITGSHFPFYSGNALFAAWNMYKAHLKLPPPRTTNMYFVLVHLAKNSTKYGTLKNENKLELSSNEQS